MLLGTAAFGGDEAGVQRAVAAGADVDAQVYDGDDGSMGGTCTAAYVAAGNGRIAVLRYLVGAGAGAFSDEQVARFDAAAARELGDDCAAWLRDGGEVPGAGGAA